MDDLLELTEQAQATHFWFQGFRRFMAPVIARAAAGRRNLRILDCGCGTGHNLSLLQPYGTVFGFDLAPGGLARARARAIRVARADVTRNPFADNSFDLVVSFDVLQSVGDDRMALRDMARVARPGGAVIFTAAALEVLRGEHSEAWQEVHRYTRASARAVAEQAGLHVERVSYLFGTLFPLILAARTAQRVLKWRAGVGHDFDVPAAPVNAALATMVKTEAALAPHLALPFGSSVLVVARKP